MGQIGPSHRIPGVVYQSQERLQRYVDVGVLTDETLVSAFRRAVGRFSTRTALSEINWQCTYAELDALTDRAASAFLRLGLVPLDRVLFQLPNSKELVIAFLGCLKAGLIPICTLAAHRQAEIGYLGRHAGARAHIVSAAEKRFDFIAFAEEMRQSIPSLDLTIAIKGDANLLRDGVHSFERLIEAEDGAEARRRVDAISHDPYQVALFQLSGGTTDIPKIIPRFHNEYLYTLRTFMEFYGFDETIVAYSGLQWIHNSSMLCCWGPAIFFGGEAVVGGSLEADDVGPLFDRRKPNWLLAPPVLLFRLKESGWIDRLDLSKVKAFATGGGVQQLKALLNGAETVPMFGMTEGLIAQGHPSDPIEAKYHTVGRPISPHDELKIFIPGTEVEAADGEVGELAIRGPSVTAGYFDAEERNKVAFTSDGFYKSGDLMRIRTIEGQRYLVFEGRIKDVVSRGGEKINCEEVERAAADHPAIKAIAVVAMPDAVYQERACAFVVPATGQSVTVADLGSFLEKKGLAKFKWPERIEFVAEFPVTAAGKLSKPKLREMIKDILKQEKASASDARARIA
ncbi:2,3-dihydroxybenzoate-AMP ligase [Bradyrhizobium elkanii]